MNPATKKYPQPHPKPAWLRGVPLREVLIHNNIGGEGNLFRGAEVWHQYLFVIKAFITTLNSTIVAGERGKKSQICILLMSWSQLLNHSCQGTIWQERVAVLILSTAPTSRINPCFNWNTTPLLKNSLHFMINYFPYRKNPDGHFQCEFRLNRWKSSQVSIFQMSFLHIWSDHTLFYIK